MSWRGCTRSTFSIRHGQQDFAENISAQLAELCFFGSSPSSDRLLTREPLFWRAESGAIGDSQLIETMAKKVAKAKNVFLAKRFDFRVPLSERGTRALVRALDARLYVSQFDAQVPSYIPCLPSVGVTRVH